jgi:hypothetical protein
MTEASAQVGLGISRWSTHCQLELCVCLQAVQSPLGREGKRPRARGGTQSEPHPLSVEWQIRQCRAVPSSDCCAVLWHAVLCCGMLCCAVACCAVLWHAVLCCAGGDVKVARQAVLDQPYADAPPAGHHIHRVRPTSPYRD